MAGDAVGAEPRYWAFISYSHKDAAFGRRLHRRLESYSLPRRLAGRATTQGQVPRRLVPIFRDREELPAAADLSTEVRAALAQSRSLIVVCSPDAAASQWVSREVELFRSLHPDRPILAAIRDGEPGECFPEALSRTGPDGNRIEPLAADFRSGRDGAQLGLLKLVAGVAGLGLDELVQRDAQRNTRRVTAITVAALIAVLVMGALTAFALEARKEAERQRGEAEGLVEYMLTDLRDRLKGVGRLDVMTAVNERALDYYKDQDLAALPVDSLERRARILHAMGEDDETRGNLDAALKKFLEAKRTTAALLATAPNDPERIYDHAQSEFWVASIDWRRNRLDAAQGGFQRYAALAKQLITINPANPDWQMEAGYAESNIGTLKLHDEHDAGAAAPHFSAALEHFGIALAAKPNDSDIVENIADGYGWLGDSQFALGRYYEARASRLRQKRLLNSLLQEDKNNAVYARDLLGNALGLGRIDLGEGRIDDAEKLFASALAQAEHISSADPEDKSLAIEKVSIRLFLAKAMLRQTRRNVDEIRSLLASCETEAAKRDQDVEDYCAVLSAREAAVDGTPNSKADEYLRLNWKRLSKLRHSDEWKSDFAQN